MLSSVKQHCTIPSLWFLNYVTLEREHEEDELVSPDKIANKLLCDANANTKLSCAITVAVDRGTSNASVVVMDNIDAYILVEQESVDRIPWQIADIAIL
ncbi:hypothetical protein E4U49_004722 [Claviceps purpurea]|nr:hypothetical protein E4U49_004722 [Claviceps purpurea]